MDESPYNCCRVCLKGGAYVPIFGEENITVNEKLSVCLGEQIQDIPGHPRHICSLCQITLNIVCQFIDQMKESQELLINGWCEGIVRPTDYVFEIDLAKIKQEKADVQESILDPMQFLGKDITVDRIKIEPPDLDCTDYDDGNTDYEVINDKKRVSKKNRVKLDNVNKENSVKKTKSKMQKQRAVVPEVRIRKDYQLPETEVFTCSLCPQSFHRKISLTRHFHGAHKHESLQRKLDNIKLFGEAVPRVKKENSNNKESILCPICGKVIESTNAYNHKLSHSDPGAFNCGLCNMKFRLKKSLSTHITRKHTPDKDKKYKCVECGKKFGVAYDLKLHKDKVHLKKRDSFKCDQCTKVFVTKTGLVMHIRSQHTGERPDICTVCGAAFSHIMYLKEHMRLHTGEMPYKCPICGRGHAQRGNMKSHLRVHSLSDLTEEQRKTMRPSYLKRLKQ